VKISYVASFAILVTLSQCAARKESTLNTAESGVLLSCSGGDVKINFVGEKAKISQRLVKANLEIFDVNTQFSNVRKILRKNYSENLDSDLKSELKKLDQGKLPLLDTLKIYKGVVNAMSFELFTVANSKRGSRDALLVVNKNNISKNYQLTCIEDKFEGKDLDSWISNHELDL
jgi:hypothetical protein